MAERRQWSRQRPVRVSLIFALSFFAPVLLLLWLVSGSLSLGLVISGAVFVDLFAFIWLAFKLNFPGTTRDEGEWVPPESASSGQRDR